MQHTWKRIMAIALLCSSVLHSNAQDESVTNAFLDLNRQGQMAEADSEMTQAASEAELKEFFNKPSEKGYYCFMEPRERSIRLLDSIPSVWTRLSAEERENLSILAAPNEFVTYQIGVFATNEELQNLQLDFSDLKNNEGSRISSEAIKCFNLEGIDLQGKPFMKNISVEKGSIQPFWIGVQVPKEARGIYHGTVTLNPSNAKSTKLQIAINVSGAAIDNHGYNEGWRMARLNWLDSNIGLSEAPTEPYIPLSLYNRTINYLGGTIEISPSGLPSQIITHYSDMNQLDSKSKNPILASPMQFVVETTNGIEFLKLKNSKIEQLSKGKIEWRSTLSGKDIELIVSGSFSFDGFTNVDMQVKAKRDIMIKDIRLESFITAYASKYIMGMGNKGGLRKQDSFEWKWDVTKKHQDALWLGNINAGFNMRLKGDNYKRPLVNVYYQLGHLQEPTSWGNKGKGGVSYKSNAEQLNLIAYSGMREMKKGEKQLFTFELLITPVKPLDFKRHYASRFYHSNSDISAQYIDEAVKNGATEINVHHKKDIYPYINYPYYDESVSDLKQFISDARAKGLGTRAYYTTRELTVKIPEIWAMRSMNSEILHNGPGPNTRTLIHKNGPHTWLNENFKENFIPAWYNAFAEGKYKGDMDLSVITTPDSRWNNYYLAGLDWMINHIGLSGVYIDDSALDRKTLQRARRILDMDGETRLIDIHSWNHFNQWAGYANSLHIYLDLLPYVDKTWIGESFPANNTLDFWLIEMAGIPYGMLSETLDAHNLYRGLVFCMPPRLPWSGNPTPIWKLWDEYQFDKAKMYGFWSKDVPVRTSSDQMPATVFLKEKQAIVVLANWADKSIESKLLIDTEKLGFQPTQAFTYAMLDGEQRREIDITQPIKIEGEKGLVIIIE